MIEIKVKWSLEDWGTSNSSNTALLLTLLILLELFLRISWAARSPARFYKVFCSHSIASKLGLSCLLFISRNIGVLISVLLFYFLPIPKVKLDESVSTGRQTYREATLPFISREISPLLPGKDASEAECIIVTSVSHAIISFSRGGLSPSMRMVTVSFCWWCLDFSIFGRSWNGIWENSASRG